MSKNTNPAARLLPLIARRLVMLVVAPAIIIATLLLLLSQGLHHYPLVVSSQDQGFDMPMAGHLNIPETLVKALDPTVFAITTVATEAEARKLYEGGQAKALLLFPAHLSEDMAIKQTDPSYEIPEKIGIELSEPNILAKLFVIGAIAKGAMGAIPSGAGGLSLDSLPIPIPIELKPLIDGFGLAPTFMVLSLLIYLSWVLTGVLSLTAARGLPAEISRIKTGGALSQAVFIVAFALAGWALYLSLAGLCALITGFALPAAIFSGSLVVLLQTGIAASLAWLAGSGGTANKHGGAIFPYFILPLFLGGFLFPVELLPVWLQWIKYLFPPAYTVPAATSLQLGTNLPTQSLDILISGLWLLAFWGLGLVAMRRPADHTAHKEQQS